LPQKAHVKIDQLKLRLGQILAEEEGNGSVDWRIVQLRSDELLGELQVPIPLIVHEYLRGSDRRQQDSVYAHAQRSQLLHFLRGH
jgi:hypothetical protein